MRIVVDEVRSRVLVATNQSIKIVGLSAPASLSVSGRVLANGQGVPDATVTLSGAGSRTATTDASGAYSFSGLMPGSYTLSAVKGGFAITPAQIVGTIATESLSNQDFVAAVQTAPAITWPTPVSIVYGTALSGTQLNATSPVAGAWAYTPPAGTVLSAGAGQPLSVIFTPTDTTSYTPATKTVTVDVAKAAPAITWTTPASIVPGTPLGEAQLNATASVAGAFVYTPPSGTVLNAGAGQTLSVGFTPSDTANYASATASIDVLVVTVPAITMHPQGQTVNGGDAVTFTVGATGTAPLSYQWRKDGVARSGATNASLTLTNVQPADSGTYDVVVSNGVNPDATSDPAVLNVVPNGVSATHSIASALLNTAGGTITVSNRFGYLGPVANLGWSVLLPTGWSFASSDAANADMMPAPGATGSVEWEWATLPTSPVTFAYTLNVPAGDVTPRLLAALVSFKYDGTPIQILAKPDPLMAGFTYSADTDHDFRISLLELTRVIELYNTRNGTVRTGAYKVMDGSEDGFSADASRVGGSTATLTRYHSADTQGGTNGSSRNGAIDLLELTRVIELYNYRAGTVRTGQYHVQTGSEDGFAAGP